MAKAKTTEKKAPKGKAKKPGPALSLVKSPAKKTDKEKVKKPEKPDKAEKVAKETVDDDMPAKEAPVAKKAAKAAPVAKVSPKSEAAAPATEKGQKPRATKLPPVGTLLTKREMEQLLTAGTGRGVMGEGSLKGRLSVKEGFPYLHVVGRDKRELVFLLQGPDQETLPAYVDHKVSVSGFIKKTTNYGGSVDVRKYTAKKPEAEAPAPTPVEDKLKYLSPGEVEQVSSAGMGAGIRGFCGLKGTLEMTGEEFFLVVSNGGTRQQVSFLLEGKNVKNLRKNVGQTGLATGVLEKSSGWGGRMQMENFEPRTSDQRAMSRDAMEVVSLAEPGETQVELKLNQGLSVRLPETPGYTWAIEPTTAKRVGLREANFEPPATGATGAGTREFFFTPRNPGAFDIEFFLAKVFTPTQVLKSQKLPIVVRPA